jgi:hypothetical protein
LDNTISIRIDQVLVMEVGGEKETGFELPRETTFLGADTCDSAEGTGLDFASRLIRHHPLEGQGGVALGPAEACKAHLGRSISRQRRVTLADTAQ